MRIKTELGKLKESDLWSLILFVLFKVKDIPEYSCLSELAYILDQKNMLKLCEYFGGCTITIPTVEEFENIVYGLLLYQYVVIEKINYDNALEMVARNNIDMKEVKKSYLKIQEVLEQYEFTSRVYNGT